MEQVRYIGDPLPRWYVVQTQPHREFLAEKQLTAQGFRAFLPAYLRTIRHSRQFRTKPAPLFHRYLFVELMMGRDRWRSVNGTIGVTRLLMDGDSPRPVPRGVVEELQIVADADEGLAFVPLMQPGEVVRLTSGPFTGFIGELVQRDADGRVRLLLSIMGGKVPLVVNMSSLVQQPERRGASDDRGRALRGLQSPEVR